MPTGTYLGRGSVLRGYESTLADGARVLIGTPTFILLVAALHPYPLGAQPIALSRSNTRESSHLAYKDTPFGVCALVRLGTTIRLIVKPGVL
jgi:hypothetical protein